MFLAWVAYSLPSEREQVVTDGICDWDSALSLRLVESSFFDFLTFPENGPNFLAEGRRIWFSEHSHFFSSQMPLTQLHLKPGASVVSTG